jgi:hypothetical protein
MDLVLSFLTIAFAAVCIWLGVRCVNRGERWAKWTLATMIGVPLLYISSIGPICRFKLHPGQDLVAAPQIYWPLGWAVSKSDRVASISRWYLSQFMPIRGIGVVVPHKPSGGRWFVGPLH